ncbi:carbamoyltransferase family protein [Bacillus thuringiensis]|uniref:carbamoyltransferase family protein n=1 Tax=Bacillus thuringiensis TaxID=1428 RepID=UPI0025A63F3D|nr:carbamoyltransferase C-terminal domain-containing protein [Bacillus thuringiensis]MDM8365606.1 carbamoyltransferase C-terminal domain-containing protein [Bacillus thuringiensis]
MYVLGVNGWDFDIHDASACLFYNGKLIAAAEEERFIRQKKALDKIPYNSIAYCLKEAKITPNEVDHIVMGWDVEQLYFEKYSKKLNKEECLEKIFPKGIFKRDKDPQIHMCSHHLAHASGAFFSSGFNEATIIVIDGSGEEESITIAKGKGNIIEVLEKYPLEHSLGIFYEALTVFSGLGRHNEGKLMGLSSYGEEIFEFPEILENPLKPNKNPVSINGKYFSVLKDWIKAINSITKMAPNYIKYEYNSIDSILLMNTSVMEYKNIAASGQAALERAIVKLVKNAVNLTGIDKLCLSGGVALNCIANRIIADLPEVANLYIQPGASDSGVSIGAATWFLAENGIGPMFTEDHVYSGPEFSDSSILNILKKYNLSYIELGSNKYDKCSELLIQNKIIGRFSGKMEFGPRALGNRSIIANPQNRDMLNKVNTIKKREQWRPLAPSIIDENASAVLEEKINNPYMLLNSTVKKEVHHLVPAIVHVDGSTRAQVVTKGMNSDYYETIYNFYQKTGIPAVMNTSFNVGKEPIICNPSDAIRSFYGSEMDALLLGSFLILK